MEILPLKELFIAQKYFDAMSNAPIAPFYKIYVEFRSAINRISRKCM